MNVRPPTRKRIIDKTFELIDTAHWDDGRAALAEFGSGWLFRGHADETWKLTTSLHREHFHVPLERIEKKMLEMFKRRAHNFLTGPLLPSESDNLSWLAIMQHFGAPTRLLDWTASPFVAAYFAFEDWRPAPARRAVWCIDQDWCRAVSIDFLAKQRPGVVLLDLDKSTNFSHPDIFEKYVLAGHHNIVVPVQPFRLDERMTAQQSSFLCPGDLTLTFLDNLRKLGTDLPDHLIKITMPGTARPDAIDELNQMNVNRGTLFPGIAGLAQSLKYYLISEGDGHRPIRRALRRVAFR